MASNPYTVSNTSPNTDKQLDFRRAFRYIPEFSVVVAFRVF